MFRIVQKLTTIISADEDQRDRVADSSIVMDDSSQRICTSAVLVAVAGAAYQVVTLPEPLTRIGFLQIETDAPILVRLNGVGDIPVSPLISPSIMAGIPLPGPTIQSYVQKGVLILRSGVNADGHATLLTSVSVRAPGSLSATVKVIVVGE